MVLRLVLVWYVRKGKKVLWSLHYTQREVKQRLKLFVFLPAYLYEYQLNWRHNTLDCSQKDASSSHRDPSPSLIELQKIP